MTSSASLEQPEPRVTISTKPSRISVYGLGYVGAVTAACLARRGHHVIGVDVRDEKVNAINQGRSPILECGLEDLIEQEVREARLHAMVDPHAAVEGSDVSLICVGTPSRAGGEINTHFVETVSRQIGEALKRKSDYHVVVVRSTVLPGTTRNVVKPIIESASGKTAGRDFGLCFNPEFLREATAIRDFYKPSKTVIGQLDERSGDAAAALYDGFPEPFIRTTIEAAEATKYADNAWHALKVAFANEMATLCKTVSVDSHEVMSIFCQDTKLNLSATYLRPGFAFGGSCLPKDVRAITAMARQRGLDLPLLGSVLASNDAHIERARQLVQRTQAKRIAVLGVTFKAGTDDLRESPSLQLIQALRRDGRDVRVFDEHVSMPRLGGENLQFLLNRVPDFAAILTDDPGSLATAEVLVVTQDTTRYRELVKMRGAGQVVIDLVHLRDQDGADYWMLC